MSANYNIAINDHSDVDDDQHQHITQEELKRYDIDVLLDKAGGFGRMQLMIIIFVFISNQGFNFFSYNFAYLELVPSLL